jgi:hypothetical protein
VAIFINYRREDTLAITGRIDDHLRAEFGAQDVFRDLDSIPPGVDFVNHVGAALEQCDVCVAVLGRSWASQRLLEQSDLVRRELETALDRGIPVIPVLVEGAELPPHDRVPTSLHPLLTRQATTLTSGSDFKLHIRRLIRAIRDIREERHGQPAAFVDEDVHESARGRAKNRIRRLLTFKFGVGKHLMTFSVGFAALSLGLMFAKLKYDANAREEAARLALVQQAEEAKKLQAQVAEQSQKVNELRAQLASVQDDRTRAELSARLADAQKRAAGLRVGAAAGGGPVLKSPKTCNCQPGDPICSCL